LEGVFLVDRLNFISLASFGLSSLTSFVGDKISVVLLLVLLPSLLWLCGVFCESREVSLVMSGCDRDSIIVSFFDVWTDESSSTFENKKNKEINDNA
jgi:hypothetical protein